MVQGMTIERFINNHLPSGSGFDCNWEFIKECKNGTVIFETYYHNMSEHGYYDGYTKVRFEMPKKINDFRVRLSQGKAKYMEHHIREYMWETISIGLPIGINWERNENNEIV